MPTLAPASVAGADGEMSGGKRHRGATAKQLKRVLKKAGLKTTGRKAALTRRAKKAHLKMGGAEGDAPATPVTDPKKDDEVVPPVTTGGRRRSSRKSKGFKLY